MEDESSLLKIKREYTHDEAVQFLLKSNSELQQEIGILKSELAEAKDQARRYITEGTQTRKVWLRDELINDINSRLKDLEKKSVHYKKSMEEWREKYFQLLQGKQDTNPNSDKNVQVSDATGAS